MNNVEQGPQQQETTNLTQALSIINQPAITGLII